MINKKKILELKKIKGKARGITLKTDYRYIVSQKNTKKIKEVERRIKKIEPKFDYNKIKNIEWYPLWWRMLSLLVIKDVFEWKDKDIIEMGRQAPKNSFIVKIVLRYFVSIEKTLKEGSKYFSKHYYPGVFEPLEYNEKEKYVRYRLKNFESDPIICVYFLGYFETVGKLGNQGKPTTVTELQCASKKNGGEYHEFMTKWK